MQTVMAERPESCSDEQDSVSVAHLMTAKQTAKGPETANENVRFMILGAGIAGKSAVKPALDRRSFAIGMLSVGVLLVVFCSRC